MSTVCVNRLLPKITGIATIPHVATRAMQVADDPNSSAADLKEVIGHDPALAATVMKTVSSAYYGVRQKVRSLHAAVALLGFKTVRNLIVHAAVSDMFKDPVPIGPYSRADLWRHMVAVGVCAGMTARRTVRSLGDEAFLAGILHDIGIALEEQCAGEAFAETVHAASAGGAGWIACEREILGFDHAELGQGLARKWRFPETVTEVIARHHEPTSAPESARTLVDLVAVADFLVETKGITAVGMAEAETPDASVLENLSLGQDDLKILYDDLDDEMEGARELFETQGD